MSKIQAGKLDKTNAREKKREREKGNLRGFKSLKKCID